ncbi:MAG: DEAD/DEAH box helicase family protein [Bacteroidota bacterium]
MQNNPYQTRQPNIIGNNRIRTPQREAYDELAKFKSESDGQEREIGIVLPVGCGKSGCITLAPFAFKATRTLVVAPGVPIAGQLHNGTAVNDPRSKDRTCL